MLCPLDANVLSGTVKSTHILFLGAPLNEAGILVSAPLNLLATGKPMYVLATREGFLVTLLAGCISA